MVDAKKIEFEFKKYMDMYKADPELGRLMQQMTFQELFNEKFMKEVLKKLVIRATARTFCNFLCIIMIIPRFCFCRTYFRNELMSGLSALCPPASALHVFVSGSSRRIFLLAVS